MIKRFILVLLFVELIKSAKVCNQCPNYRGDISVTKSGLVCQEWSKKFPHVHSITTFGEENITSVGNKCRDPTNTGNPWCFTIDPKKRFENCNTPSCIQECKLTEKGQEYRGSISKTSSGKVCQSWTTDTPHKPYYNQRSFPNENIECISNKCRNPNSKDRPWCYTTDPNVEWEYCDVPFCYTNCKLTERGYEYKGNISKTLSGKICQNWMEQTPHKHYIIEDNFKDENLTNLLNQCRNPDNSDIPWCYTMDKKKRWEDCDIPLCHKDCKITEQGQEYKGNISKTISGKVCQNWSEQSPQKHEFGKSYFPDENFENLNNYCRNPSGENLPWCFTTDPNVRWEFCDVPFCKNLT